MTFPLAQKNIVVGVSGGIACYKTCELVRLLVCEKASVHVVMTASAREFVTPMSFQALSQNKVHTDLFDLTQESEMGHIKLGDEADLVIVAPTSANLIARLAHGFCDDLLTTILCVTRAPILLAPAMNVHMYAHPAVLDNITRLKKMGYSFAGPTEGSLACGYEGLGRMEEPLALVNQLKKMVSSRAKGIQRSIKARKS